MITVTIKLKEKPIIYNYPYKGIGNNILSFYISEKKGQKETYYNMKYIGIPRPKIDKLGFTYPVNDKKEQDFISGNLSDLYNDHYNMTTYQCNQYKNNYNYKTKNGANINIACNPFNTKLNFIKLSYNPHKLGSNQDELKKILIQLFPHGINLENANITRFDVALDYHDIKPNQIMVKATKYKLSRTCCNGAGNIETHYLGTHNSNIEYCIYDKTLQLKKEGVISKEQITRIEARIRYKTLQELKSINPFDNLQIFWARPPIGIKDHNWAFFLHYSQTYGIQTALKIIPKQDKKYYQDRLNDLTCNWWNPEKLVSIYQVQINNLLDFYQGLV